MPRFTTSPTSQRGERRLLAAVVRLTRATTPARCYCVAVGLFLVVRGSTTLAGGAGYGLPGDGWRARRKVNGKCVAPRTGNKHKKRCTRVMNVRGKLVKTGHAGADRFLWNGKIGGHSLARGSYELIATVAGGASQTVTFTSAG